MTTVLRQSPSLALRRLIHQRMDTARRIAVPSVAWDEAKGACHVDPAAMKVLACMHRFASYDSRMAEQYPWYRWDADVYKETRQVQIFRRYLAPLGQEFFDTYGGLKPASLVARLSPHDVVRFRDCLSDAWQTLHKLPSLIPGNKRLYDEMFKTRQSIERHLRALREGNEALRPLPPLILGFDRDRRAKMRGLNVEGFSKGIDPEFPHDHLSEFKRGSQLVTLIKDFLPGEVRGHLLWLNHHLDGTPQCVLLLFVREKSSVGVNDLSRLWADHILDQVIASSENVRGIGLEVERGLLLTGTRTEVWARMTNWVMKMLVDPLAYQRLKLPPRRRAWSKGVL